MTLDQCLDHEEDFFTVLPHLADFLHGHFKFIPKNLNSSFFLNAFIENLVSCKAKITIKTFLWEFEQSK